MRGIRLFQRNKRYQRFSEYIYRNLQYINDFSNISIITQNISTIRQEILIKEDCSTMEQSLPFTPRLPQSLYYPLSFLSIIQLP
ncbi:hypothetical protein COM04_21860 [Bacillus wiedmannii]|nr:hypothetical protein CN573_07725 [Bacillus wiedmannii]PGB93206.1 hypothetical protein COM04_21860 [Bacillus wiedmannii]PGC19664.1 hypothetical protein COM23_26305 [Bacillus wiedmannii]PHB53385.1 hypothetical protein COE92_17490 [Bacillus wiedmannii]